MTCWTHRPIGTISEQIKTGSTPLTSHPEFFGGSIPWFTPSDIGTSRNLVNSSAHISEAALKNGKAKLFEKLMLLITCIGDIGRVGILQVPASSNQQITALKFHDEIDVYYAYYWFIHNQRILEQQASQAVVPILNNDRLGEIEFSYPPLPEQKHIAGILGKADRLCRLRRYARELSDTYLQSVFMEMFGDPVKNPMGWDYSDIDSVLDMSQYGTSKPSNNDKRGYPVLGMNNLTYSGHINLNSLTYVELTSEEFKKLRLESGDIIFNRTNSTELVGKTAHWKYNIDAVIASYLVKLKLKRHILPDYFAYLLNSKYYKALFQNRCKKAVGQSNISPTLLREFPIALPPLSHQQIFTKIAKKFERLQFQQREAERQAEHLFQTLLHRAFQEELT